MAIKVIIADDHEIFRVGLRFSLEQHHNLEVVGEASNGEQLLTLLGHKLPDIILLDLNMPEKNGMQVLPKIVEKNRKLRKPIRVIVISVHDAEGYITEAIEEGACGFLSKIAKPDEIHTAIDSVYENGFYFNEKVNRATLNSLVKRKKLHPVFDNANITLSQSELNVLKLVCKEMSSKSIANELFISTRTVEDIRYELLKKTGAKNAVGLALWAQKNNLI